MSKSRERSDISRRMTKRFVRYDEGAELYSMSPNKFSSIAKEARAVYKIDRIVLVNCEIFEEYLENYRVKADQYLCASPETE